MGYPSKQQILEACENRIRAEILSWMLWIHQERRKANPKAESDDPEMLIRATVVTLAGVVGCCERTIKTHLAWLSKRGFLVVHKARSFDHTHRYEVNLGKIKTEELPLFDGERRGSNCTIDGANPAPSKGQQLHHRRGMNCTIYIASSPSSRSTITTNADDDYEKDEEKTKLVNDLRGVGVAREQAEHWMTVNTRQLIREGIKYVALRCANEKVGNPPGLLNRFLQNPTGKGYELNKQGCWVRSQAMQIKQEASVEQSEQGFLVKARGFDRVRVDKVTTNK